MDITKYCDTTKETNVTYFLATNIYTITEQSGWPSVFRHLGGSFVRLPVYPTLVACCPKVYNHAPFQFLKRVVLMLFPLHKFAVLPEGHTGEVWQPSKATLFRKLGSTGQSCTCLTLLRYKVKS